ncbi:MAG TPA: quinone-dependent dihydroorotate dehydrogenase [Burkholderiales bacterium]|nr:quinone-dependent dihydroorotate dehydrogenase [Burkholderiales bacterium]
MLYSLLRPLLFRLDPETSHHLTLELLRCTSGLNRLFAKAAAGKPCQVMGLDFPNPVGLAAGLDKNGEYIDALATLGFGFIEVGTVTPRPQPGNTRPRLFRVPQARALVNRMGFNNHGVDRLIENIRRARYKGILGINIGKNADTPMENAADDYIACLRKVYPFASYVAINISSPNTRGLRTLQQKQELDSLLSVLKEEHKKLAKLFGKQAPLVLKIAPDLSEQEISDIAELLLAHKIDGVIATNTTVARAGIEGLSQESGGVSGAPLNEKSTAVIRQLAAALQGQLPIIGVGGIMSGANASEKLQAGASLVQIYSGLIYRGPALVAEIIESLTEQTGVAA